MSKIIMHIQRVLLSGCILGVCLEIPKQNVTSENYQRFQCQISLSIHMTTMNHLIDGFAIKDEIEILDLQNILLNGI